MAEEGPGRRAGDHFPRQVAALLLIVLPSTAIYAAVQGGWRWALWPLLALVAAGMFLSLWSS